MLSFSTVVVGQYSDNTNRSDLFRPGDQSPYLFCSTVVLCHVSVHVLEGVYGPRPPFLDLCVSPWGPTAWPLVPSRTRCLPSPLLSPGPRTPVCTTGLRGGPEGVSCRNPGLLRTSGTCTSMKKKGGTCCRDWPVFRFQLGSPSILFVSVVHVGVPGKDNCVPVKDFQIRRGRRGLYNRVKWDCYWVSSTHESFPIHWTSSSTPIVPRLHF